MKRLLCAAALGLAILLAGCSYNQYGIDALLRPPKLSSEQEKIYQALIRSVAGSNIRLKYPREGQYISAFILHNMDEEPGDEAIVFYEAPSASVIHLNILDQDGDGNWVSKYDLAGLAGVSEIDQVTFLTAGDTTYMVTGYNLSGTSEKSVVLYSYQNGQLSQKLRLNCASYEVMDINGDGIPEIITITGLRAREDGSKAVFAECRQITPEGGSRMIGEAVEMDPDVTSYVQTLPGKLSDGRPALYLDGKRDGDQISTEILGFEGNTFRNFIYNSEPNWSLIGKTVRDSGALSMDLGHDGVIDIPVRIPAPGYEALDKHQQKYLTNWYIYNDDSVDLQLERTTYVSNALGYVFTLPQRWVGEVTIDVDPADNALTVYEYDDWKLTGEKLLSLAMARLGTEQALYDKGYQLLYDKGQSLYFYKIYDTQDRLSITPDEVMGNFQFL